MKKNEPSMNEKIASCVYAIGCTLLIILGTICIVMLTGCRAIKEPVQIERVEYIDNYIEKLKIDSIFQHDSVFIKQSGDTIYEYREKEIYRNRYLHDTIHICQVDTIVNTIEKLIEKDLSKWEQTQMNIGKGTIWILVLLLIAGIIYVVKKLT